MTFVQVQGTSCRSLVIGHGVALFILFPRGQSQGLVLAVVLSTADFGRREVLRVPGSWSQSHLCEDMDEADFGADGGRGRAVLGGL